MYCWSAEKLTKLSALQLFDGPLSFVSDLTDDINPS